MSTSAALGDARAILSRIAEARGVPLSAGIEISDHCNETCAHCYQVQGQKGEMTTAEIFRILDELASMGVMLVTLSGGEATLRRDFIEIVTYAREKGFVIRLFTNGLTMTRELAHKLAALAVQSVEISLYSTHAETHDFITGVPGSFDRTVAGIRHLVDARVSVTIKTPVMSINEHETSDYQRFAAELGAAYSFSPGDMMPREGGDRSPESFMIGDRARVDILRQFAQPLDDSQPILPARPLDDAPCGAGKGIHIEPNGELRPCTMLEFDLGNVLLEGVANAHASNARRHDLTALSWRDMHGCRDCALRAVCSHCYAAALADTGDALGPYAGGCRAARLRYETRAGRAPRIVAPAGRSADIGPYREVEPGLFEVFDDVVTRDDEQIANRLGWVRRVGALPAPELTVRPGELVQIRRPGRKTPRLERVPGGPQTERQDHVAAGPSPASPSSEAGV
jgi:radical SAM protein with 4Fe4S-binding SPASM domain